MRKTIPTLFAMLFLLFGCANRHYPLPEYPEMPVDQLAAAPCTELDAGVPTVPTDPAKLAYTPCANEFQTCAFKGAAWVRFGAAPSAYVYKELSDGVQCSFQVLGDPSPGKTKSCSYALKTAAPADAGTPAVDAGRADAATGVDAGVDSGAPVVDSGAPPSGAGKRPAASKGVGFYATGGKLYDGNNNEFVLRGTNKTHQDNLSPGLGKTPSNATRWLVYFTEDPSRTIKDFQSSIIGGSTAYGKAIPIPGFWDGTCKSDSVTFERMVSRWVRDAALYSKIERFMVLNIANEWGDDPTAWKNAYVSAIPRIRAAGWHGNILVDAPGCGQNAAAIVKFGADIVAADPEKNVTFDWHIYGFVFDSKGGINRQWAEQVDLVPTMDALKASGLTVVVGEFGPGRNVGPSPTNITPQRVIDQAEAHGFGWLSWSWDDNNLANGQSNDDSFSHSYTGEYLKEADLTIFGRVVVENWNKLSKPASVLQ
jgi:mannan endo-1,4-beta-mannosidase